MASVAASVKRYAQAWLRFGVPTALGTLLMTEIVFPALLGWEPNYPAQPAGAALFVLSSSLISAGLWVWLAQLGRKKPRAV